MCLEEAASVGRCMTCSTSGRSVSQSVEGDRGIGLWENNNSISLRGQGMGRIPSDTPCLLSGPLELLRGQRDLDDCQTPTRDCFCQALIKSGQGHVITGPEHKWHAFPRDLTEVCPACVQ